MDGLLGRFTLRALREFQERFGLAVTDAVDEKVLLTLRQEVERLAG
ncbi:MAG: peptidoglycan-binding protein [Methylohalobius sp.]